MCFPATRVVYLFLTRASTFNRALWHLLLRFSDLTLNRKRQQRRPKEEHPPSVYYRRGRTTSQGLDTETDKSKHVRDQRDPLCPAGLGLSDFRYVFKCILLTVVNCVVAAIVDISRFVIWYNLPVRKFNSFQPSCEGSGDGPVLFYWDFNVFILAILIFSDATYQVEYICHVWCLFIAYLSRQGKELLYIYILYIFLAECNVLSVLYSV